MMGDDQRVDEIRKSPTEHIPCRTVIIQVRHSNFYSDHWIVTGGGVELGIGTPLRTKLISDPNWAAGVCLSFRSV